MTDTAGWLLAESSPATKPSTTRSTNTCAVHVHTNTVEGFFSVFKRGVKGVHEHCSEKHSRRYLAEFDFRYSNRAALGVNDFELAVAGIKGNRPTYRRANSVGQTEAF